MKSQKEICGEVHVDKESFYKNRKDFDNYKSTLRYNIAKIMEINLENERFSSCSISEQLVQSGWYAGHGVLFGKIKNGKKLSSNIA